MNAQRFRQIAAELNRLAAIDQAWHANDDPTNQIASLLAGVDPIEIRDLATLLEREATKLEPEYVGRLVRRVDGVGPLGTQVRYRPSALIGHVSVCRVEQPPGVGNYWVTTPITNVTHEPPPWLEANEASRRVA